MEGMRGRMTTRPLGSVRPSLTIMDTVPKFPPLRASQDNRLDKNYQGIAGSAMMVPPTKAAPEKPEPLVRPQLTFKVPQAYNPHRTVNSSKSDSNSCKSEDSAEKKELKEAMVREKELKQQLMSLQKVIDDLKVQIQVKEKTIADLQAQFQRQEERYKELYEKEQAGHQQTRANLDQVSRDLEAKVKAMEQLRAEHEAKMAELQAKMEDQLSALRAEKDKEIAERDKKVNLLKQHMADALKGNSWFYVRERQQQIDELTKELSRNQEEVESLRHKLKALQKGGGSPSDPSSDSRLQQALRTIGEKDQLIQELKALCARFEKQLKQQDVLLANFTNTKGHKPLK